MQKNVSLKAYNTFGLDVKASRLQEVYSLEDVKEIFSSPELQNVEKMFLGGGSNVLFTADYPGVILVNRLEGIHVLSENDSEVRIEIKSGENWHRLVLFCVERGWAGIENLSLIPGTVGAAPMQNIGAYGVEIKDVLEEVNFMDLETLETHVFSNAQCDFGYRESVFKHGLKGKAFIISITLRLSKEPKINVSYGAIKQVLDEKGILNPGIADVSNAVIEIRKSKLPDPSVLGNAGSFFKNPEIPEADLVALQQKYPGIPFYPVAPGKVKIPAGWLIEQAGWKGKRVGNTGSHAQQALVLVNYGGAKGEEIKNLAHEIIADIDKKFGIRLSPEVNFVPGN